MRRHNPLPYSPHLAFLVSRAFTFEGRDLKPGEPFDASQVTEQRLRQFFDARLIAPTGFAAQNPPAYLENGRGLADKLAEQLKTEEGSDDDAQTTVGAAPSETSGTDAEGTAAAAAPAPAESVAARPARKRGGRKAA